MGPSSVVRERPVEHGGPYRTRLRLLGGFRLEVGGSAIYLPPAEQRLLACLALADRPQARSRLAGRFWPDISEVRAMARLRTAIWRLRSLGSILIASSSEIVAIGDMVSVDVDELTSLVHRSTDGTSDADAERLAVLAASGELLPDMDDEWLIPQRERFRQIRLHALERLGERLASEGRFAEALEVSLAVVADDPLRESAERVVIKIHAAEGNLYEALRRYRSFRDVIRDELGLEPSPQMEALVDELGIGAAREHSRVHLR